MLCMFVHIIIMYLDKMKCTNCGNGEIIFPESNQSIDDYLKTKKCSNCGEIGKWKRIS